MILKSGISKTEMQTRADDERRRCREWLGQFMQNGQPRIATKLELRKSAMCELGVSKSSFDVAWIWAIEENDRQDWYEPLRRRSARS